MCGERVAGEVRLVQQQHTMSLLAEQDRQSRSCDACPNDDDVVIYVQHLFWRRAQSDLDVRAGGFMGDEEIQHLIALLENQECLTWIGGRRWL